jgi:hypothetical protein
MKRIVSILAVSLAMTHCGGGGNTSTTNTLGSTTQSTAGQAQGVYSGSTSTGLTFESIVLPNDKMYALYGTTSGTTFFISGFISGQGVSNKGSFTASVNDYYYTGLTSSGSVTATYVPATSLNGTLAESGLNTTFTGTAMPSAQFNYNTPATVSQVAGTWSGTFLDGTSGSVTITSAGAITGSNSGCSFSGTLSPDASKNFYNLSVTFGTTNCLLPAQTVTGIGVSYLLSNGINRQLLLGGSLGTKGTVFIATK